jgi:hypothetical protein
VSAINVVFERRFEFGIDDEWARFGEGSGDLVLGASEIDAADPIVDDTIDVGEIAAEQLALEIDPFPRAPGAVFDAPTSQDTPGNGKETAGNRDHPFAILKQLRERD